MQSITRPLDRSTLYTGFNYDVTDSVNFFANASYGKSESTNSTYAYHSGRYGMTIGSVHSEEFAQAIDISASNHEINNRLTSVFDKMISGNRDLDAVSALFLTGQYYSSLRKVPLLCMKTKSVMNFTLSVPKKIKAHDQLQKSLNDFMAIFIKSAEFLSIYNEYVHTQCSE